MLQKYFSKLNISLLLSFTHPVEKRNYLVVPPRLKSAPTHTRNYISLSPKPPSIHPRRTHPCGSWRLGANIPLPSLRASRVQLSSSLRIYTHLGSHLLRETNALYSARVSAESSMAYGGLIRMAIELLPTRKRIRERICATFYSIDVLYTRLFDARRRGGDSMLERAYLVSLRKNAEVEECRYK